MVHGWPKGPAVHPLVPPAHHFGQPLATNRHPVHCTREGIVPAFGSMRMCRARLRQVEVTHWVCAVPMLMPRQAQMASPPVQACFHFSFLRCLLGCSLPAPKICYWMLAAAQASLST